MFHLRTEQFFAWHGRHPLAGQITMNNECMRDHFLIASTAPTTSCLISDSPDTATTPPSLTAESSVFLFITMMLMRRFTGLSGSILSNSTADDRPTTRNTLASLMPPTISSRRQALARSADNSQLL